MISIFWLAFLGLIIYLLTRHRGGKPRRESTEYQLAQRNIEWTKFIAGYRNLAKTQSEKDLLDKMLGDIKSQGLVANNQPLLESEATNETPVWTANSELAEKTALATVSYEPFELTPVTPIKPRADLDNISLLLYFGAFLFVASVGLFIVFGGASGLVRTVGVLLVMVVMYGTGIYFYRNMPKLTQAGLAFSGIGMTIAPLAGVAAYNYMFHQTYGPAVWFATSLLCLGMYVHALIVFRRPLVSYILIFTFLSLFESGVSIISAPIYYFGWAMALVGIVLAAGSRIKGYWPELQESSRASSQLLLPLAVLASIVLVPTHGAGQLGVSLLLAAAFYGLEALNSKEQEQQSNVITTHITALAGIICLSYAFSHSWRVVAVTMLVTNMIQAACVILNPPGNVLWRNFASVLLGSTLVCLGVAAVFPNILLVATGSLVAVSAIVWLKQRRIEGYVLTVLAWMALPLVFGQYYLTLRLEAASQAMLLLSALLVQLGVYLQYKRHHAKDALWIVTAHQMYVFSCALVLIVTLFASAWICFALSSAVIVTIILLATHESDPDWAVVAGMMATVPVLRAVNTEGPLVAAHVTALALNIGLALWYRKEVTRWFSTAFWLALPLSLGSGLLGGVWTATSYAWAYVVVMLGLVLSRAIARGVIFMSTKISLSSYAKTASYSYLFGYCLAAILAVGLAVVSPDAQVNTTLVLGVVAATVYVLSQYIEKRADLMTLLPFLAQAILWSAIRPVIGTASMDIYLLAATTVAAASYFAWPDTSLEKQAHSENIAARIRDGALFTVFVTPLAIFVTSQLTWPMPLGLFVAGALVYYHFRNTSQTNREGAATIMVAAVLWFMWFAGIREVQAYTHVIVGMLAFYAYWRHIRGDTTQSDQYVMYMLATATFPLALQAISNQAGGFYGWWLLLEQIAIMLIGMALKKRVVTLWGLYVAVGAVLYQLRNLGWAALTVLAMFLIGIAIYQLQRHEKS